MTGEERKKERKKERKNTLYFYPNTDCIGFHHSNLLHTSFLGPENYLYDQKDTRATTNCISVGGKTKLIIMFLFPEQFSQMGSDVASIILPATKDYHKTDKSKCSGMRAGHWTYMH